MTRPSIGRVVHFVDPTTGQHQAAIITAAPASGVAEVVQAVTLSVLGEDFISFKPFVPYDAEGKPGTWHWPERVE